MTDPAARLFYLLATDDDPVPRVASFATLFPDGLELGTTSEDVATLKPGECYHAGVWAAVRCDLAILDTARELDGGGDDATLAATYLSSPDAGAERAAMAAAIRQLVAPAGDFAIGDDRGGPEACECGAPFAPHPGAPGEHTRTCDCDELEPDAPADGGGQWERRQLGIGS